MGRTYIDKHRKQTGSNSFKHCVASLVARISNFKNYFSLHFNGSIFPVIFLQYKIIYNIYIDIC